MQLHFSECFQHCWTVLYENLRHFITNLFDIMCRDVICTHSILNSGRLNMIRMEGGFLKIW